MPPATGSSPSKGRAERIRSAVRRATTSRAAEPPDDLQQALANHAAAVAEVQAALGRITKERPRDEERYLDALASAPPELLSHPGLVRLARARPLEGADSFWRSLIERRRKKQLGAVPERYLGITKDWDWEFVNAVGVPTAEIHYTGPFAGVRESIRPQTVVKPLRASGSAGAFFVFDLDRIVSISTTEEFGSVDSMLEEAAVQLRTRGGVDEQTWQIQEMIIEASGAPARDLKFYCFYGEIGLIVEISRFPTTQYAYFNGATMTQLKGGNKGRPRFTDPDATLVDHGGVSEAMLEDVRALSREIPAPFMRIDCHAGAERLVFCEFSSAPGGSNQLPRRIDRMLGRLYHVAEIRLANDLLDGRTFDGWQEFNAARRAQAAEIAAAAEAGEAAEAWGAGAEVRPREPAPPSTACAARA